MCQALLEALGIYTCVRHSNMNLSPEKTSFIFPMFKDKLISIPRIIMIHLLYNNTISVLELVFTKALKQLIHSKTFNDTWAFQSYK